MTEGLKRNQMQRLGATFKKLSPANMENFRVARSIRSMSTAASKKSLNSGHGIVPSETIAGQALMMVIAIMAFLVSLTIGAVSMVNQSAQEWQNDISKEVTIQIRPFDNVEMDDAVRNASRLALTFDGVEKVTALTSDATAKLLEPWLGSGLQLDELPVPRLLTVSIADGARPNLEGLRAALVENVPGASLDDHRAWVDRLTNMAWALVFVGVAIFVLVMAATVLTVVFATRGAMAGNKDVVEVLHFVGADARFIANQFQHHFLLLGLKGAAIGGGLAVLLFFILGFWSTGSFGTPQGEQISTLFGTFTLGWTGYVGIVLVLVLIAFLSALTSRLTVANHVDRLYSYRRVGS